jgi:ATP-binding cassette subfamily B protein
MRLLKYLAPYRKQVMFGMGAAAVITMVSLVPPFLAGYVIDNVVRPVQAGTMSRDAGASIAWLAVARWYSSMRCGRPWRTFASN